MKNFILLFSFVFAANMSNAQEVDLTSNRSSKSIAVLSMDCIGIDIDNIAMGNLVRLELEKTGQYEVMDKYDVAHQMKSASIDQSTCFGKNQLIDAGNVLKTDYMLTGSVERFGDKIIYTLRLIDVKKRVIEKATVLEFVNQIGDIQAMTSLIINKLLELPYDQVSMEMLASFDKPITNSRASLSLNGPRFGIQYANGELGKRLVDDSKHGGLGLNSPMFSSFGYQWETQYISAGEFQALFEFIPTVNAIETGTPAFALSVIHGMRFHGWEFGFGPTFRITKLAEGYYNDQNEWTLAGDVPAPEGADVFQAFDARGPVKLNTGLVVALGKTIHSGYLNFPINFFWSPSPQLRSNTFGLMVGFNIAKSPMRRVEN